MSGEGLITRGRRVSEGGPGGFSEGRLRGVICLGPRGLVEVGGGTNCGGPRRYLGGPRGLFKVRRWVSEGESGGVNYEGPKG